MQVSSPGLRVPPAVRLPVRRLVVLGAIALGLGLGLGGLILLLGNGPLGIDEAWMSAVTTLRADWLVSLARGSDFLGGGWFAVWVVPVVVAAAFLIARRPWSALTFVVASAASAGIAQLLKGLLARPRPADGLIVDFGDLLASSQVGSFPSGHTTNAATIAVLLGLLVGGRWVWAAGIAWVVLMAFARTLLGAHWLSDTVGAALLGAGAVLLVCAAMRGLLAREALARRTRTSSIGSNA